MKTEVELDEALRLINVARVACGARAIKRIPKGKRTIATECPVKKALRFASVVYDVASYPNFNHRKAVAAAWGTRVDGNGVRLPNVLFQFVKAIDRNEYPDLLKS